MTKIKANISKETLLTLVGTVCITISYAVCSFSANSACLCLFHQPELPESAKKLRKF
ncbi:MAG: cyclic lactone autoinducer peptide [Eubacteriales bacterium]